MRFTFLNRFTDLVEKIVPPRQPETASQAMKRYAKRHGLKLIEVKSSRLDPADLRGLPRI